MVLFVGVTIPVALGGSQPVSAVGKLSPGERRCFEVSGSPRDVALVKLTPVKAEGRGHGLLVWSEVVDVPVASNVNFDVGTTDPNVAAAAIGVDGQVCYVNSAAPAHLVADHLGTIDAGAYTAAQASGAPLRRLDTRGGALLAPGARRCFPVAGSPGDVALVNLTPVQSHGRGYGLLVSSDVVGVPVASSVNFDVGTTDPNVAAAAIGADGQVCYLNSEAATHLVADHLGTIDADSYTAAQANGAPLRMLDTRGGARLAAGARRCFPVAGSPGDVALVNLTPVQAHGRGYGLLVSSDVTGAPVASNVNFAPGSVDPNVAFAPIGSDGQVCYHNSMHSEVDLVADHLGTIASESFTPANPDAAPQRTVDTRDWRPDVYLNFHGSEQLLGATDAQWQYVRKNLDGFWGHWSSAPDHETQLQNTIELTRKIVGRKLVAEHAIANADGSCGSFMEDWFYAGQPGVPGSGVEGRAPDIRYERVAAALYAGDNPDCWGAVGGISAMFREFQGQGYDTVYALYQATNLIDVGDPGEEFPLITPGSSGDLAYRNAGAVVIECQMDDCLHPMVRDQFFRVIAETHARGASFVWFTGYHQESGIGSTGWLAKIQQTYDAIAAQGLWRPGDAITLINYYGSYPALPERRPDGIPADTVTGILAWLLEQRPDAR